MLTAPCKNTLKVEQSAVNQRFSTTPGDGLCLLTIDGGENDQIDLHLENSSSIFVNIDSFDTTCETKGEQETVRILRYSEKTQETNGLCKVVTAKNWRDMRLIAFASNPGETFTITLSAKQSIPGTISTLSSRIRSSFGPRETKTMLTLATRPAEPLETTTNIVRTKSPRKPLTTDAMVGSATTYAVTGVDSDRLTTAKPLGNSGGLGSDVMAGIIVGVFLGIMLLILATVLKKRVHKNSSRKPKASTNAESRFHSRPTPNSPQQQATYEVVGAATTQGNTQQYTECGPPSHYGMTSNVIYDSASNQTTRKASGDQDGQIEGGSHYGMVANSLYQSSIERS